MEIFLVILVFLSIVALALGLISPSFISRVVKRKLARKNVLVYFGSAALFFFVLFAVISEPPPPVEVSENGLAVTQESREGSEAGDEGEIIAIAQEEDVEEVVVSQSEHIVETSNTETTIAPSQAQPSPPAQAQSKQEAQQPEPDPEPEQQPEQESGSELEQVSDGRRWYVSAHHSSQYYYCEESDGWKNLSETWLRIYDSEMALLSDFPNHTLHTSCR